MAEKAAHLVDHVFPKVPVRQWVLTLPPPLRYLLAYNAKICSEILSSFLKAVFRHQRHKAKKEFGLNSVKLAHTAAITAIQRCGSALNLNVHFHSLVPDGVFVFAQEQLKFRALPKPTHEEIEQVAWNTCQRAMKILEKRGMWIEGDPGEDLLAQEEPALASLASASIQGTLVMGPKAGQRLMRFCGVAASDESRQNQPGAIYGFNLHAARRVRADDRTGLERLCQYILRPPIANDRLSRLNDGAISLRLKRPWSDGTSHILFSPQELVAKLVPLIPAPGFNRLRYHGLFAPHAKYRKEIIPEPPEEMSCSHAGQEGQDAPSEKRYTWAKLMARVFEIDVLESLGVHSPPLAA
jgi:hypothetical protein